MCVSRSTFASFIYRTDPGRYKELADFTDTLCLTLRVQHDVLTSELQSILLPLMRLSAIQDGSNKFIARSTISSSWQKLHEELLSSYQTQVNSGLPPPASVDDQPPLTSLRILRGVLQFTATGLREGSHILLDTVANFHSTETSSFWNPFTSTAPPKRVCVFTEQDILASMASQDARVASLAGGGGGGTQQPADVSTVSPPLPSPQHRDDPERSGCSILSIHSHFQEDQTITNKRPAVMRHYSVTTIDDNDDNHNNSSHTEINKEEMVEEEDVHTLSEEDLFAMYMQNEEIRMLLDWKIHLQNFTSDAKKASSNNGAAGGGTSGSFAPLGGARRAVSERPQSQGGRKGAASKQHKSTPHHIQLGFTDLSTLSPADIESSDVLNLIAFGKMASAMSLLTYQWDTLKTTATGGNEPTIEEVADLLKTLNTIDDRGGEIGSIAVNRADRMNFVDTTGVETDEQINAIAKLYVKGMKIALKHNKFRLYLEHLKEAVALKHAQERHRKRKVVKNRLLNCFKTVAGMRNPLLMMAKAAGRGANPSKPLLFLMGKGSPAVPTLSTTVNPLTILPPTQDQRRAGNDDQHQQPCSTSTIGSVDII